MLFCGRSPFFLGGDMGRPAKTRPTCTTCGRSFDRRNNLEWHEQVHKSESPVITGAGPAAVDKGGDMAEGCTNCHSLEHKLEKQDAELGRMAEDLQTAATALRQPPEQTPGHQDILQLLDCPGCGPSALSSLEEAGGAVLRPGSLKPELAELVKKHFPIFGSEVKIP